MSSHASRHGQQNIEDARNFSRFCIENRHISWVLLLGTVFWGIYGYLHMPQRKDPDIPVKQAMVVTPWPGASAEKIEDLVTRTIERSLASNANVARIESTSRSNVSVIIFSLADELAETGQVLDDIGGRLAAIEDLPDGAGPIDYLRDFGDTATLMLTVASPKADAAEVALRAREIRSNIETVRAGQDGSDFGGILPAAPRGPAPAPPGCSGSNRVPPVAGCRAGRCGSSMARASSASMARPISRKS